MWLVRRRNSNELSIFSTHDGGCPVNDSAGSMVPLLVVDVWEHAYYVDHRNARPKYMDAFWRLVAWDLANSRLLGSFTEL